METIKCTCCEKDRPEIEFTALAKNGTVEKHCLSCRAPLVMHKKNTKTILSKRGEVECLKCENIFMSPDRTKIRRCNRCKGVYLSSKKNDTEDFFAFSGNHSQFMGA